MVRGVRKRVLAAVSCLGCIIWWACNPHAATPAILVHLSSDRTSDMSLYALVAELAGKEPAQVRASNLNSNNPRSMSRPRPQGWCILPLFSKPAYAWFEDMSPAQRIDYRRADTHGTVQASKLSLSNKRVHIRLISSHLSKTRKLSWQLVVSLVALNRLDMSITGR